MTMIADNIYNLVRKTLITTENNNDVNASIMTMAAVNIYNLVRKTLIMLIIIMKVVIINCQNNGDDDDDIYIYMYICMYMIHQINFSADVCRVTVQSCAISRLSHSKWPP